MNTGVRNVTKFLWFPQAFYRVQNAADTVLRYLKESRLNRNIQKVTDEAELIISKTKKGRPVILFAGQNDFECGIYPYTEHAEKYHSPVFKSSDEAALYLYETAGRNNWNFIYKPHPLMLRAIDGLSAYSANMLLAKEIDINEIIDLSDVCVTILSQTAYIALIRQKAVLTLGFTQLYKKSCCYEAFRIEDIEPQLKTAIDKGFAKKQSDMFKLHISQMLKYRLFDDLVPKDLRYGQTIDDCAQYVKAAIEKV